MAGRGKRRTVVEMLSADWVESSSDVSRRVARLKLRMDCGHVLVVRSNRCAAPEHALCVTCAAVGVSP